MIIPLALVAAKGEHTALVSGSYPDRLDSLCKCDACHVSAAVYDHQATLSDSHTCRLNIRRGLTEKLGRFGESDIASLSLIQLPPQRHRERTAAPPGNRATFDSVDSGGALKPPAHAYTVIGLA